MFCTDPYVPILTKKYTPELDKKTEKPIEVTPVSIEAFINLIKKVECESGDQACDPKRTITQVRKVFYGEAEWDKFVISADNARNCPDLTGCKNYEINCAKVVRLKDEYCLDIGHVFAGLDALQYEQAVSLFTRGLFMYALIYVLTRLAGIGSNIINSTYQSVVKPFIRGLFEPFIKLTSGLEFLLKRSGLQIGDKPLYLPISNFRGHLEHLRTLFPDRLIDFPQALIRSFPRSIERSADFATWLGDLGDLLKESHLSWNGSIKKALTPPLKSARKWRAVPGEDMLGNIDAYVIYKKYYDKESGKYYYPDKQKAPPRLSDILWDYYITKGFAYAKKKDRYKIFAEFVGLGAWNGQNFDNEGGWENKYKDQVRFAAVLCVGAFSGKKTSIRQQFKAVKKILLKEDGTEVLKLCVAGLKKTIQEPHHLPRRWLVRRRMRQDCCHFGDVRKLLHRRWHTHKHQTGGNYHRLPYPSCRTCPECWTYKNSRAPLRGPRYSSSYGYY